MRRTTIYAFIVLYLSSCVTLVLTMKTREAKGWSFPWAGPFIDKRLRLHNGAVVYAWPSAGGRLELQNPSAFELNFLGIQDHMTECDMSPDPAEEDAFAERLRRLGGTFYKHRLGVKRRELLREEVYTWLGWPEDDEHSGGVWVLKANTSERHHLKTGRISLANTMQERCRAIEMCGGVFYEAPTEEHLVPVEPVPKQCRLTRQEYYEREDRRQRIVSGSYDPDDDKLIPSE